MTPTRCRALVQEPWELGLVYVPGAGLVPTTAPACQPAIDMRDSTMSSNCRSDLSGPNMQRPTNKSPIPVLIPAGVLLVALSAASPALARSNFDGDWSVVIETRGGACMPSLRYPIAITNGFVTNAGDTPGSVQGRVAPSGAVRVTVQSGGTWANGSGRLTQPAAAAFGEGRAQVACARAHGKHSAAPMALK